METDTIYNMDCLEGMKLIPDGSVDLIVTDPPYEFKDTTGDGTFREFCAMDSPGLFNYVGKPPKNGKDKPYIYLDVDFV